MSNRTISKTALALRHSLHPDAPPQLREVALKLVARAVRHSPNSPTGIAGELGIDLAAFDELRKDVVELRDNAKAYSNFGRPAKHDPKYSEKISRRKNKTARTT